MAGRPKELCEKGLKNLEMPSRLPDLIYEMGGARMGRDTKISILNGYNQMHSCPKIFVTDGAAMTSTGTQNPSMTYMALSARVVGFAVKELNKGGIK